MAEFRTLARTAAVVAGLACSSTAFAAPWDIDLVDAYFYRGYEWKMMSVPEGAVSQNRWAPNADRFTPEGQALTNPYPVNAATTADGEKLFNIYCATCHGLKGQGGAAVVDLSKGQRYPVPPPRLSGEGAVTPIRTDGYLYLTIRNGGALMGSYGSALDDQERWSIVSYIRTLDGAAYNGAN